MNRQMWHSEVFYRDVAGQRWISFNAMLSWYGLEGVFAIWIPDAVVRRKIEVPPPFGSKLQIDAKLRQFDGPDHVYEVDPDLVFNFFTTMREALTLAKQHPVGRNGYMCLVRRSITDPLEISYTDASVAQKFHAIIP